MRRQRGFTMIEVLVAMGLLTVALVGILAMQKGAFSASGYSRRAGEAAVLAEDKLEQLRTLPIATAVGGQDVVDSEGVATSDGPFTRTWTIVAKPGSLTEITCVVNWDEGDGTHAITVRTRRNLT